jgi:diguanylate cyclase (GGDEF)-like protein
MKWIAFFNKRSRNFWVVSGAILVILVGIIDYLTGVELSISLFYLIPILLAVWFADEKLGLIIAAISAITWFLAEYANRLEYPHLMIFVWNTLIRLAFFIIAGRLLSELKHALRLNQELTRIDYTSRAVSIRYFYELAQNEINRLKRYKHPFSIAYIDLDNFKGINDRFGHHMGDTTLRILTTFVQKQIRSTDIFARLGGDEFVLLLPETDETEAREGMNRINALILDEMQKNSWAITFSIGVVTYHRSPGSVDEMLKQADGMMYAVKTSGKDGIQYLVESG